MYCVYKFAATGCFGELQNEVPVTWAEACELRADLLDKGYRVEILEFSEIWTTC